MGDNIEEEQKIDLSLRQGNNDVSAPVQNFTQVLTAFSNKYFGAPIAYDDHDNAAFAVLRAIDPTFTQYNKPTILIQQLLSTIRNAAVSEISSERMVARTQNCLAKGIYIDFVEEHQHFSVTTTIPHQVIDPTKMMQLKDSWNARYRFTVQNIAQLYWARLTYLLNPNVRESLLDRQKYVKGMSPLPYWDFTGDTQIMWSAKLNKFKNSTCYFDLMNISQMLLRSLFRFKEVSQLELQSNASLLEAIVEGKDQLEGGYIIYKQKKYNKYGFSKRQNQRVRRIIKKVVKTDDTTPSINELALLNKQTYCPFKICILIKLLNELAEPKVNQILLNQVSKQSKKNQRTQLLEDLPSNELFEISLTNLSAERPCRIISAIDFQVREKGTKLPYLAGTPNLVLESKWEIEQDIENRSRQFANALLGRNGRNYKRRY